MIWWTDQSVIVNLNHTAPVLLFPWNNITKGVYPRNQMGPLSPPFTPICLYPFPLFLLSLLAVLSHLHSFRLTSPRSLFAGREGSTVSGSTVSSKFSFLRIFPSTLPPSFPARQSGERCDRELPSIEFGELRTQNWPIKITRAFAYCAITQAYNNSWDGQKFWPSCPSQLREHGRLFFFNPPSPLLPLVNTADHHPLGSFIIIVIRPHCCWCCCARWSSHSADALQLRKQYRFVQFALSVRGVGSFFLLATRFRRGRSTVWAATLQIDRSDKPLASISTRLGLI